MSSELQLVFESHGGLLNISDLGLEKPVADLFFTYQKLVKDFLINSSFKPSFIEKLDVVYTSQTYLNAFATMSTERYVIGVNVATFPLILNTFRMIFASNDILLHIGDAKSENLSLADREDICSIALRDDVPLSKSIFQCVVSAYPEDPTRRKYFNTCYLIACLFILFHELGHIISGHVGYLRSQASHLQMSEYEELKSDEFDFEVRQALEFDADRIAVALLYNSRFNLYSGEDSLEMVSFGLGILFRMMALQVGPLSSLRSFHPHPDLRLLSVLQYMRRFAGHGSDVENEKALEILRNTYANLDIVWQQVGLPMPTSHSLGVYIDELEKILTKLETTADNLKPNLKDFIPTQM